MFVILCFTMYFIQSILLQWINITYLLTYLNVSSRLLSCQRMHHRPLFSFAMLHILVCIACKLIDCSDLEQRYAHWLGSFAKKHVLDIQKGMHVDTLNAGFHTILIVLLSEPCKHRMCQHRHNMCHNVHNMWYVIEKRWGTISFRDEKFTGKQYC